jgi:hypothetical protein
MIERTKKKQVGTLLDPKLYRQMKSLAALRGCRTGELIDDAIRQYLKRQPEFKR